jgi:Mg2+ and Co2+ transporter CorA
VAEKSVTSHGWFIFKNENTVVTKQQMSVFLMPPTLIAGFYGMNVRLPMINADDPNANFWNWVIIVALMALSCLLVFVLFRRKKLL